MVAADRAQTGWVDIEVWEKFALELPNEETREVCENTVEGKN